MVPIYALNAVSNCIAQDMYYIFTYLQNFFCIHATFLFQWVGLSFPNYAIYLDTCRECYEAYVNILWWFHFYNKVIYILSFLLGNLQFHDVSSNIPKTRGTWRCWIKRHQDTHTSYLSFVLSEAMANGKVQSAKFCFY